MKRQCNAILIFVLFCAAGFARAENIFSPSGFETWDAASNRPDNIGWRWHPSVQGENGFTILEQSDVFAHSGKYSLHLKDDVAGNYNHSLGYQVAPHEIAPLRGKTIRISAWVKQISSKSPNSVGIAMAIHAPSGNQSGSALLQTREETDWTLLQTTLQVPADADGARFEFCCASGWNNRAEAYFDDVIIEEAVMEQKQAPAVQKPQTPGKTYLPLFPPPDQMNYDIYGEWEMVHTPKNQNDYVELVATGETRPFAAFLVRTFFLSGTFDLTEAAPEDISIECILDKDIPIQLRLADEPEKFRAFLTHGVKMPDGRYLYTATGRQIASKENLRAVRGVNIQFCTSHPAGTHLKIYGLQIKAKGFTRKPEHSALPADLDASVNTYRKPAVYTHDDFQRPVIRNGAFFMNGKYQYFRGPWIYPRQTDWLPSANPLNISHIAYTTPPGKAVFDAVGWNSCQPSGAPPMPGQVRHGLPIPLAYLSNEAMIHDYFQRMEGMPIVLDFAFGYNLELKKFQPELYRKLNQKSGEWHEFIPFCPEDPEGDRYYQDYFLGGVVSALKNGGNPYAYELFNESGYNCQCEYNIRAFAREMQKKHKTIANANALWKTNFRSFDELAKTTQLQRYPRLWPDWCKFASRRYAAILKKYQAVIRTVDKRPNIYFTEQCGGAPPAHPAMDYTDVADACDILAMEGGLRFGYGMENIRAKSAGAEILVTSNGRLWFAYAFFRALAKDQKPIVNDEHNSRRGELGNRIPSHRSDIITCLWNDVVHGASAINFYCWDKRSWEWKTYEQAKQNAIEYDSCKSSSFLNPYNYPPEILDAPKDFSREFEPYADKILPMPRTRPGNVAFYYPMPCIRMVPYLKRDYERYLPRIFDALHFQQYDMRVVFDRDLLAGLPEDVDALVLPSSEYFDPAILPPLRKFTQRGGWILADKKALSMDEHGTPLPSPDFPVTRFDGSTAAGLKHLVQLFQQKGVHRRFQIVPVAGRGELTECDCQLIDRGDFKLVYLFCGSNMATEQIRLKMHLEEKENRRYYIQDVPRKQLLLNGTAETWSVKELAEGLPLLVPPQERVVLILTTEKSQEQELTPLSEKDLPEILRKKNEEEAPYIREYMQKLHATIQGSLQARQYTDVRTEACTPIDMASGVNSTFDDEHEGDKKGGWFDQGSGADFRQIPRGRQVFAGVPFQIRKATGKNDKEVIVLGSQQREYFPKSATVRLDTPRTAKRIYFLHTAAWGGGDGPVLTYVMHYTDGTKATFPIRGNKEICEWCGAFPLPNAKIAVEVNAPLKGAISMYCTRWFNPHPQKKIKAIEVISAWEAAVPAVAGITFEN